jgi:hypothetical protein
MERLSIRCPLALSIPKDVKWRFRRDWKGAMSPTVFRERGFRFYFFSREESRMHVHVCHADGEVKFWMAPRIEIAKNLGLQPHQVRTALDIVHERQEEICEAWNAYFAT